MSSLDYESKSVQCFKWSAYPPAITNTVKRPAAFTSADDILGSGSRS